MRSTGLKIAVAMVAIASAWTVSSGSVTSARQVLDPKSLFSYDLEPNLPVAVSARLVCRLAKDNPSAAQATVLGVDGAASTVVNGTVYWFFGDTFRQGPGGRRDVIPAAIATSTDFDARDCLAPTFKTDRNSIVQPMFPRIDEATAWPDGVLALPDGSIIFYMVKVYRQSPTEWHVGSVGLGVLPAGSLEGVRLVERIWDAESGFRGRIIGARSPVRVDDDVLVYMNTDAGNYLARAPVSRLAEVGAYTYWDGTGWSVRPDAAQALWQSEASVLPRDNGLSVTFDERIGKWLAVYNAELSRVEVRIADEPWGPWSTPVTWFDCKALVPGEAYPFCYSTAVHPEFSRDGGSTIYVTFSNPEPYDVALVELHFGVAIHGWLGENNVVRYAPTQPDDSYRDAGVAFYASDAALPGLAPIYEVLSAGGYRYTPALSTEDASPVFFAYAAPPIGAVPAKPVYRWERKGQEILDDAGGEGWVRGDIAFYVPCVHTITEMASLKCSHDAR